MKYLIPVVLLVVLPVCSNKNPTQEKPARFVIERMKAMPNDENGAVIVVADKPSNKFAVERQHSGTDPVIQKNDDAERLLAELLNNYPAPVEND